MRALLAYLAAESSRPHQRDQLAGLLWSDWPQPAAMKNLRTALYNLRKNIDDHAETSYLHISRSSLQFNPACECWVDVVEFESALTQSPNGNPNQEIEDLRTAVDLYGSGFLAGFSMADSPAFEDWLRAKAGYYRRKVLRALGVLVDRQIESGAYKEALQYARQAVEIEPWYEPAHRQLINLLALQGRVAEAAAQYEHLRDTLQEALNIEPSEETQALLAQVRAGEMKTALPREQLVKSQLRQRHNLPLELTSFIGREEEVEAVTALIKKHRLVTLTGAGGSGKTRLSLRAAEAVPGQFPDGVWFAELSGLTDRELVPRAILTALDLPNNPDQLPLEQLKAYCKQKQLLVILDNCEHLIGDCARVSQELLLVCPEVKILASSQENLNIPGEVVYLVPTLPVPAPDNLPPLEQLSQVPSVHLFSERAQAVNSGFAVTQANASAVAQICKRLDGIPLAIELAAARANAYSPAQIAERLDNRFRLLTSGARTALPRHQTLRASIDWSYSILSETEQLLLMRLSVFQGGWTLSLAVEVCSFAGLDEYDVMDDLALLVSKSLIFTDGPSGGENRYRMLETIRQYAGEALSNENLPEGKGSDLLHKRHLEAFLHLAEEYELHFHTPQQMAWADRLEQERDNLDAALTWAIEWDSLKGLHLTLALFWFWLGRYQFRSNYWLEQFQAALAKQGVELDQALKAETLARHAAMLCATGQFGERVVNTAETAIALAEGLGAAGMPFQLGARGALGWNAGMLGQNDMAYQFMLERYQIAEKSGDRFETAQALADLSSTEPDPHKARAYAERNLELRRGLGDLGGLMQAQGLLGSHHFAAGEFTQAQAMYEASLQIARDANHRRGITIFLTCIGFLQYALGNYDQTIQYFLQSLDLSQDIGDFDGIAMSYNVLGLAYSQKGDYSQAERYFHLAIESILAHQLPRWDAFTHIHLAESAWSHGRNTLANQYYQRTITAEHGQDDHILSATICYAAGKIALLGGDPAAAQDDFRKALQVYTGSASQAGVCIESLAVCAAQTGDFERAARLHGIAVSRLWLDYPSAMPKLLSYDLDELLAPAKKAVGVKEYDRLIKAGKAMPLEEAVRYALEEHDD